MLIKIINYINNIMYCITILLYYYITLFIFMFAGTSCSSPVTAGLVSLLNAARFANGQSTLGYLNPTLYAATYVSPCYLKF